MKKKLTIGIFLALAVVLVASIVGVGVADAGKPVRTVTAYIDYIGNGDGAGNVTLTVSWDNYGAWGIQWRLDRQPEVGFPPIETIATNTTWFESGRTTSGSETLITIPNQPCPYDYFANVYLVRKSGKHISWASGFDRVTANCSAN
jgi:hypothetical protein